MSCKILSSDERTILTISEGLANSLPGGYFAEPDLPVLAE